MCEEITYPLPTLKATTVEDWEWIYDFNPHFTRYVITFLRMDESNTLLVKGTPRLNIGMALTLSVNSGPGSFLIAHSWYCSILGRLSKILQVWKFYVVP